MEEKEFYLNLFSNHPCSVRECERMIDSCTYKKHLLVTKKLSHILFIALNFG